jgi:hypothetical protein
MNRLKTDSVQPVIVDAAMLNVNKISKLENSFPLIRIKIVFQRTILKCSDGCMSSLGRDHLLRKSDLRESR